MKNYRRILAAALAAICLTSTLAASASASDGLDGGLSSGGPAVSLTPTSASMGTAPEAGIYWIGSFDAYQALNLQYDRVDAGLCLDPMDFQNNELFVVEPVDRMYFTLAPLSHPDHLVTAPGYCRQLRVSRASSSDPSAQWTAVPSGGGRYVLVNRRTGLAMDCEDERSATGTRVLAYTRHGGFNQDWSLIRVSESTTAHAFGRKATLPSGTYAIRSSGDAGKCLNDQFASRAGNGTAKIVLDTYNGESNEHWIFTDRGNGQYTVSPSNAPGVCLNVWAADPGAGNQLTLASWQTGDQCSLWELYQEGSLYGLRNVRTGLWVNLWMDDHTDGQKIVGYYYDGSGAMKWRLTPVSGSASSPAAAGYAAYNGVDYRAQTSNSRRIAACDKAVKMATVLWTAPCSFPTWRGKAGGYNTVTATDGTRSQQFIAGKTYQGIPYSMAGRTYDDVRWRQLLQNGVSAAGMTGRYYTSRADTTARGIDCSYLVCTALNAGCGSSIDLNTASMLRSSRFVRINRSQMLPGDVFLKSGHVMLYMGRASGGKYAVIEAAAGSSRVVYNEYSASALSAYGSYRYTGF